MTAALSFEPLCTRPFQEKMMDPLSLQAPQSEPLLSLLAGVTQPTMIVSRELDVLRVYNSASEFRITMDAKGVDQENLKVTIQQRAKKTRNHAKTKRVAPSIEVSGVLDNGERFTKTLPLPCASLDLVNLNAKLANGILVINAPKAKVCNQPTDGEASTNNTIVIPLS